MDTNTIILEKFLKFHQNVQMIMRTRAKIKKLVINSIINLYLVD